MAIITLNNNSLSGVTALPAGVGGKVLQVVNNNYTTYTTTGSTSVWVTASQCDITVQNASSYIQLLANFAINTVNSNAVYRIDKIISGARTTLYTAPNLFYRNNNAGFVDEYPFMNYYFAHGSSIGTTITLETQVRFGGGTGTINLNSAATSFTTLMEIA